jgi:hypothetical protein
MISSEWRDFQAGQVVRESVAHAREQARHMQRDNSEGFGHQARAISEIERSRRFRDVLGFLGSAWDSAVANVMPVAASMAGAAGKRGEPTDPEFRWAQQAMAYLVLTLTPSQLELIFDNDRKAVVEFVEQLDGGAQKKVERDALAHVLPVVRVLRSERFRDLTQPDQRLAARFIIRQMAMHQMSEYGNGSQDRASGG